MSSHRRCSLYDVDSKNICSKLVMGHYMYFHKYDPDGQIRFKPWKYRHSLTHFTVSSMFGALPARSWLSLCVILIEYRALTKYELNRQWVVHTQLTFRWNCIKQVYRYAMESLYVRFCDCIHENASAYNAKVAQDVMWKCAFRELLLPACYLTQTTSQCY